MNYSDLQAYLPASIEGYVAGDPGGSSMSTNGMSFSSADIEFSGEDGKTIRITLLDYSEAIAMYQAATAMWTSGMSFEDDVSKVQTFQLQENVVGWEEFRKKEKEAQIALGIGSRFFLTIEANKQNDTDFVKEIATNMELEELAEK